MRARLLLTALALASATALAAPQEPKKSDKDNKTITVVGCLDGSYLKVRQTDTAGFYVERYLLQGSKKQMKEMVSKYNSHVLEVTGHVTDVAGAEHAGRTTNLGKTKIYVGAKDVPVLPQGADTPTLAVESYAEQEASCR